MVKRLYLLLKLNSKKLSKKGVLLVNLGSPKSTKVSDVRNYLDEFLMDERVIDIPYWKRFLLIKGIILNTRPKKSAKAYKKIWWKEGSPLIVLSERFKDKLSKKLKIPVALGMRYGEMSIKNALLELNDNGVDKFLLIPLYPHYAMSSFETVVEKVRETKVKFFPNLKMDVMLPFYNQKDYIRVMANNIKKYLQEFDYDYLLFSYHGIPERHIVKTDLTNGHCKMDGFCCETSSRSHDTCYRHQCFETTKAIVKILNLKEGAYSNSFQSRLLKDPWLKPYTDFELEKLVRMGVKKLAVITPSFVTDCLETLEEIAIEAKEDFLNAGGTDFMHIPCLNDNYNWVETVYNWVTNWELKGIK